MSPQDKNILEREQTENDEPQLETCIVNILVATAALYVAMSNSPCDCLTVSLSVYRFVG